jgi:hypothetical protein
VHRSCVAIACLVAACLVGVGREARGQRIPVDAEEIARSVGPAVVYIRTHVPGSAGRVEGSGFIVTSNGWVVTNQHVLADSDEVGVWVSRADGFERYPALVVSSDDQLDIALLKIDAVDLPAARLTSEPLAPGTAVASVGFPEGTFDTRGRARIRLGVASQEGFPVGGAFGRRWVVSDVMLREGNSGGPLVDGRGRVVGVNTIRRLDGVTSISIPIAEVMSKVLAELTAVRERIFDRWQRDADALEADLTWLEARLIRDRSRLGPVSATMAARELTAAQRLLVESATAQATNRWVLARRQMEGARHHAERLRITLANLGLTPEP